MASETGKTLLEADGEVSEAVEHGIEASTLHVVMEGTGVYHELAALSLSDVGVMVSIVMPNFYFHISIVYALRATGDDDDPASVPKTDLRRFW